jgi:hypothetical protein
MGLAMRKLRHWKQQFNENAVFVWRKNTIWIGNPVKAGDVIPEELFRNKGKLKRFWDAKYIELAEFSDPDVLTGASPPSDTQQRTHRGKRQANKSAVSSPG